MGAFTLAFNPMFTLLVDGNGDQVTIDDSYDSGTITVQSGGVVPEPASLAIWTGLIAAGVLYARRRPATCAAARATS